MDGVYLKTALEEAKKGRGFVAPNPAVGAVLVRDGKILARGTHCACGSPHAEVVALAAVSAVPHDATLYVTLEPCNHFGRTPPCTHAIRDRGVRSVTYAYGDPNPHVAGGGHGALESFGIQVRKQSVPEIDRFYQSYCHWTVTARPWVTVKIAQSLDGKMAGPGGERVKISGEAFDRFTHERRRSSDGILTSSRTILNDDPRLDARLEETTRKRVYVIDSTLRLLSRESLRVFHHAAQVILFHSQREIKSDRARLIRMPAVDLREVMNRIGLEGVHDLWVEAGPTLTQALFEQDCVDEAYVCIGGRTVGRGTPGPELANFNNFSVAWHLMGQDAICHLRRHVHGNRRP